MITIKYTEEATPQLLVL